MPCWCLCGTSSREEEIAVPFLARGQGLGQEPQTGPASGTVNEGAPGLPCLSQFAGGWGRLEGAGTSLYMWHVWEKGVLTGTLLPLPALLHAPGPLSFEPIKNTQALIK